MAKTKASTTKPKSPKRKVAKKVPRRPAAKREPKATRENFNDGGIKRLAAMAYVSRISAKAIIETRKAITNEVNQITEKCVSVAEYNRRSRLMYKDLKFVVMGYDKILLSKTTKFEICKSKQELEGQMKSGKGHCLVMSQVGFKRQVREAVGKVADKSKVTYSTDFFAHLQWYIERCAVGILNAANDAAKLLGKRDTVLEKDVAYVYNHQCKPTHAGTVQKDAAKLYFKALKSKKRSTKKKATK